MFHGMSLLQTSTTFQILFESCCNKKNDECDLIIIPISFEKSTFQCILDSTEELICSNRYIRGSYVSYCGTKPLIYLVCTHKTLLKTKISGEHRVIILDKRSMSGVRFAPFYIKFFLSNLY